MDDELIERLHAHPLSIGRRLFALDEMLTIAQSQSLWELVDDIDEAISWNRDFLRRRTSRYVDDPTLQSESDPATGPRTHVTLPALVEVIMASHCAEMARILLAPIEQQIERIETYAEHRTSNDTAALGDRPSSPI